MRASMKRMSVAALEIAKDALIEPPEPDSDESSTASEEEDKKIEEEKEQLEKKMDEKKKQKNVPEPELFTHTLPYCVGSTFLILVNMQVLAFKTDTKCHTRHCPDSDAHWDALDQGFTALFLFETLWRMLDAKPRRYFCGERSKVKYKLDQVNCVDFFLVFLRILDVWILAPAGAITNLRSLSSFRIIQASRLIKHLQLVQGVRELWLVMSALSDAIKTLLWCTLLLLLVTWVLAVLIVMGLQGVGSEDFDFERAEWAFEDYWGTVSGTVLSMFQFLTRDKWADSLIFPVTSVFPAMGVLFIAYYCLGSLSVMNAITGNVVESTLSSSKARAEKEAKEKEKVSNMVMDSLRNIFREADTDGSGELDREELHVALGNPRVRDRLALLQIPPRDLDMLFMLLDEDQTHSINCNMFFRGVSKLRGLAPACDLHQLSVDINRNLSWCEEWIEKVADCNDDLEIVVNSIDELDSGILQGGQTDAKDPVLLARRARSNAPNHQSRGAYLRGTWNEDGPVMLGSKDPWLKLEEEQNQSKESSPSKSKPMTTREANRAAKAAKKEEELKKAEEKEKKRKKKEKIDLQPPPPPLPLHLQIVKEQRDETKKKKKAKAVRKAGVEAGGGGGSSGSKKEYNF
mmetsp:Transcript_93401/g.166147  ORF Transcript_93401/g.166147 Transcript_93401/m.166147 type:complete len:630 (-) Transcript_93401:214-2103(-)